nr:hypothetical protein [Tanacetum cinerariifolium]
MKYTTFITKTKAAKYDTIEGIEDMVPSLRILVKASNRESKREVFSIKRIIAVTHVKVMKWYDYGYVEEIIVRREINRSTSSKKMFTRHVIILKRVEYLQLGVKIYQTKLISPSLRLSDEHYKFCDNTLTSVRKVLHDISSSLEIDYLPKRRWSKLDRKRSRITVKAIDQQLFKRRLMRNLEKVIGGRDYGNDFRMFERAM